MNKYQKLVRDKIPEIIEKNNGHPIVRILDDDEYKQELEKKLEEELNEVLLAPDSVSRIEELADMLEVISALAYIEKKSLDDVITVAKEKALKRGKFKNKIYLENVQENNF